jgi:RNA polymerase sigma-70 factor, ECF subfamily
VDEQTRTQQARNDRALIARMQRGEPDAIESFYNGYYSQFLCVALRLTNDFAAAQDAAHDAVLRVIERVGTYDPDRGSPRAWFMQVLTNILRDRARRAKVRRAASLSTDDPGGAAPPDPPAREPSAEDRAEAAEKIGAVQAALMMLTADQRTLIVLRDYEGLSAPEAAAALGTTTEKVGSRLFRARAKLRELLEAHWSDLFGTDTN